ncbi:hypothetical protein M0802_012764 [Mischocyttarus mexicanus]|nr:hypothetical protein M0802_012764 [Mischocyttarus mexicanus]
MEIDRKVRKREEKNKEEIREVLNHVELCTITLVYTFENCRNLLAWWTFAHLWWWCGDDGGGGSGFGSGSILCQTSNNLINGLFPLLKIGSLHNTIYAENTIIVLLIFFYVI